MELKLIEMAQPHVSYYKRQAKLTAKQIYDELDDWLVDYNTDGGDTYRIPLSDFRQFLNELLEASK